MYLINFQNFVFDIANKEILLHEATRMALGYDNLTNNSLLSPLNNLIKLNITKYIEKYQLKNFLETAKKVTNMIISRGGGTKMFNYKYVFRDILDKSILYAIEKSKDIVYKAKNKNKKL